MYYKWTSQLYLPPNKSFSFFKVEKEIGLKHNGIKYQIIIFDKLKVKTS